MILFFDTETTGFFQERLPIEHPDQPHIVQLAMQLCDDDGTPISSVSLVVNPGVDIPERASAVHGITTERAKAVGVSPKLAMQMFHSFYTLADVLCAHNIKFDRGVVEASIARLHGTSGPLAKTMFCTMEAATPIINLPPTERMVAAGFNKPKPPKLEECIRHFFNEALDDAHDALVDVAACRRVYFHLKTLGA